MTCQKNFAELFAKLQDRKMSCLFKSTIYNRDVKNPFQTKLFYLPNLV